MVANIDIDAFEILEQIENQMRLKISKKLRTDSHNTKFTDS